MKPIGVFINNIVCGIICGLLLSTAALAAPNWHRDPFSLPDTVTRDLATEVAVMRCPDTIKLKGTLTGAANPLAFINEGVYAVGDEIQGFKIMAVRKESVKMGGQYRCVLSMTHLEGGSKNEK